MIINAISDLHGYKPELSGGDLLIIAGDCTANQSIYEINHFKDWIVDMARIYEKIIIIGGNHDEWLENRLFMNDDPFSCNGGSIVYLEDSSTTFRGYKIYGSPWTPTFKNWHFMKDRGPEIRAKWDLIPEDTDILITHGPPHGILDSIKRESGAIDHVGCEELRKKVWNLAPNLLPLLHIFGHIHSGYGEVKTTITHFINCSVVNEDYKMVNKPIRIELPERK
jgi:Icc-related predicted phosphoesterase